MAIAHLSIRAQTRSRGHSMAGALAYRFGLHLVDQWSGRSHDYRRRIERQEIATTGLARPDGLDASISLADPQALADLVDSAERRVDSILARDIESAIPAELDPARQLALVEDWTGWLAERYRTPIPYAIHRPPADGDERNVHVHALMPARALADDGRAMGPKLMQFHVPHGSDELRELRQAWAGLVNHHLRQAGLAAQIDMGRTRRGRAVHLGPRRIGRLRRQARRDATNRIAGRGVIRNVGGRIAATPGRVRGDATEHDLLHWAASPSAAPGSAPLPTPRDLEPEFKEPWPAPRQRQRRTDRTAAPTAPTAEIEMPPTPSPPRERRRRDGRTAAPTAPTAEIEMPPTPSPPRERRRRTGRNAAPTAPTAEIEMPPTPSPPRERRRRTGRNAAPTAPTAEIEMPPTPSPPRERRRRTGRNAAPTAPTAEIEMPPTPSPPRERRRRTGRNAAPTAPTAEIEMPPTPSPPRQRRRRTGRNAAPTAPTAEIEMPPTPSPPRQRRRRAGRAAAPTAPPADLAMPATPAPPRQRPRPAGRAAAPAAPPAEAAMPPTPAPPRQHRRRAGRAAAPTAPPADLAMPATPAPPRQRPRRAGRTAAPLPPPAELAMSATPAPPRQRRRRVGRLAPSPTTQLDAARRQVEDLTRRLDSLGSRETLETTPPSQPSPVAAHVAAAAKTRYILPKGLLASIQGEAGADQTRQTRKTRRDDDLGFG